MSPTLRLLPLAALTVFLGACDESIAGPIDPVSGTITVDASATYAYVSLTGDDLGTVAVADPGSSTAWDLGFFSTTVTSNGGAAGPGGVEVACVCANQSATDAQVMAMTPEAELADFDAVDASDVGALTFATDALAPAINGWYAGSGGSATVTAGRSWIIREGSPTAVLAKFRIVSLGSASGSAMGTVTFEYAVQAAVGEAFGPVQQVELTVGTTPVYFDLTTGAETSSADWDLQFSGWTIRLNSGVSGTGTVRAVVDDSTPFADITSDYAGGAPVQAFSADAYGGTFAVSRWYRYNLTGSDNQIWPTFNVYVIRRGSIAYKVQLISYYGPTGATRQITIRYQRLGS